MDVVAQLWLSILVSAVIVFTASFLAWMVLPHHKKDVKPLPDEKALTAHLQKLNVGCGHGQDMKSEEFKARYDAGPWGSMNILDAKPNFGRNLVLTFLFYILVSLFVGYITLLARPAGSEFLPVFRVAGAAGVLAYCAGSIPNAIFFGKPGRFVLTEFVDGVVYGLLTGATFALLWPAA
ncbi:MAG: hypothetical protein ACYSVY_10425 [Planctomycetota bacterium]|jgi:hypothetical protein